MSVAEGQSYPPCVLVSETLINPKWRCCGSWWTCVQLEVGEKGGHRGKNKTFSLSHSLPAMQGELIHSKQAAAVSLNVSM